MAESKKTVVLGASANPSRYSYLAIQRLQQHKHPVIAIGKREGQVSGVAISKEHLPQTGVDTVTLYLNPQNQLEYYDYILDMKPKRLIFNPGTENSDLAKKAKEQGIEPVMACTLVMLGTGQY